MQPLHSEPVGGINENEIEQESNRNQVYVTDLTDNSSSDKTSNVAIATEFFEEYVCDEDEQNAAASQVPGNQGLVRKSSRNRRPRQLSPESKERERSHVAKRPRTSALPKVVRARKKTDVPFKCDLCGSAHVTDPSRRGNRPKTSPHAPSPRHKLDPETGKMLTLCNACGKCLREIDVYCHCHSLTKGCAYLS